MYHISIDNTTFGFFLVLDWKDWTSLVSIKNVQYVYTNWNESMRSEEVQSVLKRLMQQYSYLYDCTIQTHTQRGHVMSDVGMV